MNKKKLFCLIISLLLLMGCGGSQIDEILGVDLEIPTPTDPTIVEDGVTGGTFSSSSGAFTASVPAGSMPAALRANPTITGVSVDTTKVLSDSETLVSDGFELDLASEGNFITSETVEVTITFNSSNIPASKLKSQYVYAKIYRSDSEASLPVMGIISGSSLKLELKGLAKKAVYTVVYNPNTRLVISDQVSGSSAGGISPMATSTTWETNKWIVWYDHTNDTTKTVIAGILGADKGSLTEAQMDQVVEERVADNAASAGSTYQTAGFRQPNLAVKDDTYFYGSSDKVFVIYFTNGGSCYEPGIIKKGSEILDYSYGVLYIDPERIDDTSSNSLGTIKASVSHEMFHAIQNGYDLSFEKTIQGYQEGPATTYGCTIDQSATEPQVRTAGSTEVMYLSTYLGCENFSGASYAYANQDFFAYVARKYNMNSLDYLKDVYEQIKTDVDALVAAGTTSARLHPPRKTLREALNNVFSSKFSKDLPTVYFDFARQRAMEHSVASQLRSGEPDPMTLNTNLFHREAISQKSVDPEDLLKNSATATISGVTPFSASVFIIKASKKVKDGVSVYLTITPTVGSLGTTCKAIVYRNGVGTELSGSHQISDFGSSENDKLTVLVSNVDYSKDMNISYTLGANKESSGVDSFIASVVIMGTNYDYSPNTIAGAFASFSGKVKRSNLPSIYTSEGSTYTDLSKDCITIITDPNTISTSGGSYAFNEADKVFEDSNGSASIEYFTPSIKHADDGAVVVFESTGGTITFTSYTSTAGDRLIGTFTALVSGDRRTGKDSQGNTTKETLTGTITGSFDVELKNIGASISSSN